MKDAPIPLDWIPTLPRRYATSVIDALLVIFVWVMPAMVLPDNEPARIVRIGLALAMLLLYEPICTGRFVTVGQWVTGVRVRDYRTGGAIGVPRAWLRIVVKVVLGVLSFLIMPFSPGRRTIHDIASGSIVVRAKAEDEFRRWTSGRAAAGAVAVDAGS